MLSSSFGKENLLLFELPTSLTRPLMATIGTLTYLKGVVRGLNR